MNESNKLLTPVFDIMSKYQSTEKTVSCIVTRVPYSQSGSKEFAKKKYQQHSKNVHRDVPQKLKDIAAYKEKKIRDRNSLARKWLDPKRQSKVQQQNKLANKLDKKYKVENANSKHQSQSGLVSDFDPIEYLSRIASTSSCVAIGFGLGSIDWDELLNQVETMFFFYQSLREATTFKQILSISLLYCKTLTDKSLTGKIVEILSSLQIPDSQSDGTFNPCDSDSLWIKLVRNCSDNWEIAKTSPLFKHVSTLISIVIALNLCGITKSHFNILGFKMFSESMLPLHSSASDFFEAITNTFFYFVESGYECFKQRSLAPLFLGDKTTRDIYKRYQEAEHNQYYVSCGNLGMMGETMGTHRDKLRSLHIELNNLRRRSSRKSAMDFIDVKISKVCCWLADTDQAQQVGKVRDAPYAIGLVGPTAVGKTTVAETLMMTTLASNNYPHTVDNIISSCDGDKFDSTYHGGVTGVYLDDVANTKEKYIEQAPTAKVIRFINNAPVTAVKADLADKGKISINPKVVVATTNSYDMGASIYSNCPESILRRFNVMIDVKPRPQYVLNDQLCPALVEMLSTPLSESKRLEDLWLFTVKRTRLPYVARCEAYDIVSFNNVPMLNVSIYQVIEYISIDSKAHFKNQNRILNATALRHTPYDLCEHGIKEACSFCSPLVPASQAGLTSRIAISFLRNTFAPRNIYHCTTRALFEHLNFHNDMWIAFFSRMIPNYIIHCDALRVISIPLPWKYIMPIFHIVIFFGFGLCIYTCDMRYVILLIFMLFYLAIEHNRQCTVYNIALLERTDALQTVTDDMWRIVKYTGPAAAALYLLYKVLKTVLVTRQCCRTQSQGNLSPTSIIDIDLRDTEANVWATGIVSALPCSTICNTMTTIQGMNKMSRNVFHVLVTGSDGLTKNCDAVFIESNVALFPRHILVGFQNYKVKFICTHAEGIGNFTANLSHKVWCEIPDTDFTLVHVVNSADRASIKGLLPIVKDVGNRSGIMMHIDKEGILCQYNVSGSMRNNIETTLAPNKFYGFDYKMFDGVTFPGLCMSPILSSKHPMIIAFHLGGFDKESRGVAGVLLLSQYEAALQKLNEMEHVLPCHLSSDFPDSQFGIPILTKKDIHVKSAFNYLNLGANVDYYGQCGRTAKFHSLVESTIISDSITAVFGVPQCWGPPQGVNDYPFQKGLAVSSLPTVGFDIDAVHWSIDDYYAGFYARIMNVEGIFDNIHPLTDMQTLCGIDGKRFIDHLNLNTSMGFPLGGKKSKYITYLDPLLFDDFNCPITMDDEIMKERDIAEIALSRGFRCNSIFKASLKDEPTKLSKTKMRIFHGAPIVLQLLVRKYYLPIVRLFSLFPLHSECAVGINPAGPEWEQLHRHMTYFGDSTIIAGDYKGFDLSMSPQLMWGAFDILLKLAKRCGYSDKDIIIMRGLATEIIYSFMNYNGDLLRHHGSNPSGQNLTVYINSIVNALMFRCAFYNLYGSQFTFRSKCALITYGDDAVASVHNKCMGFDFRYVREFYANNGIVFTLPDKSDRIVEYMSISEVEFLKRKSVLNDTLGLHLGALNEDSIFKSLHCCFRSVEVSNIEICESNIDGALFEWFLYGRDVYDKRAKQILAVAKANAINIRTDLSYDERLVKWKEHYGRQFCISGKLHENPGPTGIQP
jgi:flagellar biosynthesis GTPase FlhF